MNPAIAAGSLTHGALGLVGELSLSAQLVVILILAVFGIGMWAARRGWYRLRQEEAALRGVQRNSTRLQEEGETPAVDKAAWLTRNVEPKNALICTRLRDLEALQNKAMDIPREALAATASARLSATMSGLRYVTGILILIGLMGTLIGLTQAVIGLSGYQALPDTLSQSSIPSGATSPDEASQRIRTLYNRVEVLLSAVQQTLTGMRTAFLASLLAVLLTLVLSLCSYLLQRRQIRFLADLEDYTTTELVPFFLPPKMESVLDGLITSLQTGTTQLLTVVETIDDRAAMVGENLQYLFTIVRALDAGWKQFETNVSETFQASREHLERTVQRFLTTVDRLGTHEASMQQALAHLQTFCTNNADLGHILHEATAQQASLQEELQRFAASHKDLVERRLTDLLTHQHQQLKGWSEAHERANHSLLQSIGEGRVGQLHANGLLQQLLEHHGHAQEQNQESTAQVLHYQRQSAEGIASLTTLLERQHSGFQEITKAIQQSIIGQQQIFDLHNALGQTALQRGTAFSLEKQNPESELTLLSPDGLPSGSSQYTLLANIDSLQQELKIFVNKVDQLYTMHSDFYTKLFERQQYLMTRIERIQESFVKVLDFLQRFMGFFRIRKKS